jgi:general stress protein 26
MSAREILAFMRTQNHGVVSSLSDALEPQSAVVGYVVSDSLELVFDTLGSTRKAHNLKVRPRCSFVMWDYDAARTVQLEGFADEPQGDELERCRELYFAGFPDGRERAKWPGITWVRIRPKWVRLTDFSADAPVITLVEY